MLPEEGPLTELQFAKGVPRQKKQSKKPYKPKPFSSGEDFYLLTGS
jgi:hypothetical protein